MSLAWPSMVLQLFARYSANRFAVAAVVVMVGRPTCTVRVVGTADSAAAALTLKHGLPRCRCNAVCSETLVLPLPLAIRCVPLCIVLSLALADLRLRAVLPLTLLNLWTCAMLCGPLPLAVAAIRLPPIAASFIAIKCVERFSLAALSATFFADNRSHVFVPSQSRWTGRPLTPPGPETA